MGAGLLSFGAPAPAAHAPTHVRGGTDEIDGDVIDIDYVPTNYTRDPTPPEVTNVEELTAHLAGIDNALGQSSGVLHWGDNSVASSTATRYLDPGFEARTAPLSPIQVRAPRTGTIQNMYVVHNSPGGTGATITYTLRVAGVASALSVGLASTATSGADTVSTVAVTAGDLLDIEVTKVAAAGGGQRQPVVSVEFAA